MTVDFFMVMIPPTTTHQEQRHVISNTTGRVVTIDSPEVKAARAKLTAYLAEHAPRAPLDGPIRLQVMWCFPITGKHKNGEYKTSRPDTDNLQKLLKDCMTKCKYWYDDAQVCVETVGKLYSDKPGIMIQAEEINHADA